MTKAKCDFCRWALVERTAIRRRFVCTVCETWYETPISVRNEINYKTGRDSFKRLKPPADQLGDQATIYDVLREDAVLDLDAMTPGQTFPHVPLVDGGRIARAEDLKLTFGERTKPDPATVGGRYL